jgi:hypothetical protein
MKRSDINHVMESLKRIKAGYDSLAGKNVNSEGILVSAQDISKSAEQEDYTFSVLPLRK